MLSRKKCLKLISLLNMLLGLFIKMKYLTSESDSVFSLDFYLAWLSPFFTFTSVFVENTYYEQKKKLAMVD